MRGRRGHRIHRNAAVDEHRQRHHADHGDDDIAVHAGALDRIPRVGSGGRREGRLRIRQGRHRRGRDHRAYRHGQALGLAGTGAFEVRRGRTTLATIGAVRRIGAWSLSGKATIGRTEVDGAHDLMRIEPVLSTAFSIQAARPLFGGWGKLGLSSPLRVQRARAILSLPVGYDLAAEEVVTATRTLDLTPSARELDVELGWSAWLSPTSSLRLGVAHAFAAGNVTGRSGDAAFLALVIR